MLKRSENAFDDKKDGFAPEDERLLALQEAREAVQFEVDKFTASPVVKFSRSKFFLLTCLLYCTVWIAGYHTGDFWKWHLLQYLILLPLQLWRWAKLKKLAYMAEFCWITNFSIMVYLALIFWHPDYFHRGIPFRMLFAFASGPLGFAIIFTGNALVAHSIDHIMMLLIHLQPMLTAYTLKWYDAESFETETVSFWEYFYPPAAFVALHTLFHILFFYCYGLKLAEKGYESAVDDMLYPGEGRDSVVTQVLGKDGVSDGLKLLALDLVQGVGIALLVALTYPLYVYGSDQICGAIVMFYFFAAAWNGAAWYHYRIGRLTSELEQLVRAEQGLTPSD